MSHKTKFVFLFSHLHVVFIPKSKIILNKLKIKMCCLALTPKNTWNQQGKVKTTHRRKRDTYLFYCLISVSDVPNETSGWMMP